MARRSGMRRSVAAVAMAACAMVVAAEDQAALKGAAANKAMAQESTAKWATVLANAFMSSGSPDKAVNNIAQFHSLFEKELASQGGKWSAFQSEHGCKEGGDCIDLGRDIANVIKDGGILAHPIPEVSITQPQFFTDGTANVTSSHTGASLSSAFINYAPCLIPITPYGAGVFPQGFNIQPQIFGANPQASNIQPQAISIAPTGILVAPIAANFQPQGFQVAPTLFSISPIRTVVSKTGPVAVAPNLISATIPRGPGP